jgi:hypothetical protein
MVKNNIELLVCGEAGEKPIKNRSSRGRGGGMQFAHFEMRLWSLLFLDNCIPNSD